MNDEQYDALKAVQTAQNQLKAFQRNVAMARRHLRRARTRLRAAIAADPREWDNKPNRFPYVDSEIGDENAV